MKYFQILILLMVLLVVQPAWSQSMMEYGGVNGMAAGLGAGLAASIGHGAAIQKTFQSAIEAQQYAVNQTKAVQQYVQLGVAYEAKKQWESAERCYSYALRVIAQRDGPGSDKQVPVLKHLVDLHQKQNNLGQAIGYQQTIVRFAAKNAEPKALVSAQQGLGNLYIQSQDYSSAEPVLRESVAVSENNSSVPVEQRLAVRKSYAHVLRQLGKDDQASAIEDADRAAQSSSSPSPTAKSNAVAPPAAGQSARPTAMQPTTSDSAAVSPPNTEATASSAGAQADTAKSSETMPAKPQATEQSATAASPSPATEVTEATKSNQTVESSATSMPAETTAAPSQTTASSSEPAATNFGEPPTPAVISPDSIVARQDANQKAIGSEPGATSDVNQKAIGSEPGATSDANQKAIGSEPGATSDANSAPASSGSQASSASPSIPASSSEGSPSGTASQPSVPDAQSMPQGEPSQPSN
jgi:hypothetical protein